MFPTSGFSEQIYLYPNSPSTDVDSLPFHQIISGGIKFLLISTFKTWSLEPKWTKFMLTCWLGRCRSAGLSSGGLGLSSVGSSSGQIAEAQTDGWLRFTAARPTKTIHCTERSSTCYTYDSGYRVDDRTWLLKTHRYWSHTACHPVPFSLSKAIVII